MGMYTQVFLAIELNSLANPDVLYTLHTMVIDSMYIVNGNEKVVFESERSQIMFKCSSAYFVDVIVSKLKYCPYSKSWSLLVHSHFKNYDSDIEKFIEFIKPYCRRNGLIGYSIYEEDEQPTLYFKE
jgi:hypothetical protein